MELLLPTAYLPPVEYMALMVDSQSVKIEMHETYRKQTLRNHTYIYGPNGKQLLTVPVIKTDGNHTKTRDITLSSHQDWQRIHWKSIETAYNNSPFFLFYSDLFRPLYSKRFSYLTDLNEALISVILRCLKTTANASFTTHFEKDPARWKDLRDHRFDNETAAFIPVQHYHQVFEPALGFIPNLSMVDLIFNLGPEALPYLVKTASQLSPQI